MALDWGHGLDAPRNTDNAPLCQAAEALRAYFKNGQEEFIKLPLEAHGTAFQRRVWAEMQKIPSGEVKTYGQIAKILNSSARAIGTACGANPLPILIPCHRVVSQSGLGGYSGGDGLETKISLLRLEGYL
jgi:methylated-DNA-[protein]-cysteine S-methyltransferase